MATKPRGEQLRFSSSRTGEHDLDAYFENAEHGDRTLADLLSDIFDENGDLVADLELRVDSGKLQFRYGIYVDPEAGWTDLHSYYVDRGAYTPGASYNALDIVSYNEGLVIIVEDIASAPGSPDPSARSDMEWLVNPSIFDSHKAEMQGHVDIASGHADDAASSASASASSASASATQATTASGHADDAEAAQLAAEAAQSSAEGARDAAEGHATAAAADRAAAETARITAQNAAAAASSDADDSAASAASSASSASAAATSASNASTSEAQALQYRNDAEAAASAASGAPIHKGAWDASGGTLPATPGVGENHIYVISVAGTLPSVGAVSPGDELWYTQDAGAWFVIATGGTYVKKVGDTMTGSLGAPTFIENGVSLSSKYLGIGAPAASVAWGSVTGKPTTFDPSAHTHTIANVTGLQTALDGKSATGHTHSYLPLTGGNLTGVLAVKNIRNFGGDGISISAGEMHQQLESNMGGSEYVWLGGESGVKIVSSPDNMSSPWADRNEATLVNSAGDSDFPGDVSAVTFTEGGTLLSAKYLGINAQAASAATATTATRLATSRTITLTGDVTGSASFDGSANISISATVPSSGHNHDDRYVLLSGSTLTGPITLQGEQYNGYEDTYALDANNSDIVGVNAIYFHDTSNAINEGIAWPRDSGTGINAYSYLRAYQDTLYFTPDGTNNRVVWHAGNDGPGSGLDADLLDGAQASYFTNATNLSSGTVNSARLSGTYAISITGNAATATNADTLDGVNSTSFLRSDASDIKTSGLLRFNTNVYCNFGNSDDVEQFFNGGHFFTDINTGHYYIRSGSTTRFELLNSGEFRADGNVIAYYSDERLKNILGRPQTCLEDILDWRVIEYYPTAYAEFASAGAYNSQKKEVGLSAQSVQQNTPEAIELAPFDLDEDGNSLSGENYLTLKDRPMLAKLVGAVQELTARVKQLEAQLENTHA